MTIDKPFHFASLGLECFGSGHYSELADNALELGVGLIPHVSMYTFPGGVILSTGLQNKKSGMRKYNGYLPFTNAPVIDATTNYSLSVITGHTCSLMSSHAEISATPISMYNPTTRVRRVVVEGVSAWTQTHISV